MTASPLPDRPPFAIRARILSPLDDGSFVDLRDGLLEVDATGRISRVADAHGASEFTGGPPTFDLRPLVVMPGLVDLHAHLPQLPVAGLGQGLDLLSWLERYVFPLERAFDEEAAARLVPLALRSMASAGTTTVVAYGAVYESSMDVAFAAAERHGIRAILGKVMMDRHRYDPSVTDTEVLDLSLRQSADLCARWHGRDGGRLGYAFTPRFAVSCSAVMLAESARLARETGAWWQTHLSEDRGEIAEVATLFPEARDYLDVYDRTGGVFERSLFAHAVHLSDREIDRLVEADAGVAHCPASNLFLASGVMPLGAYLDAGVRIGLGSDVAGGPDLSLFSVMRVGAYAQNARRVAMGDVRLPLPPSGWLRLATLGGARALGMGDVIGSLETGKEADLIAVDPSLCDPVPWIVDESDEPDEVLGRLIFRTDPRMVRGAWVRGRLLRGRDDD